jgi:hypothetical protein
MTDEEREIRREQQDLSQAALLIALVNGIDVDMVEVEESDLELIAKNCVKLAKKIRKYSTT